MRQAAKVLSAGKALALSRELVEHCERPAMPLDAASLHLLQLSSIIHTPGPAAHRHER
jgi:hypothetical protein